MVDMSKSAAVGGVEGVALTDDWQKLVHLNPPDVVVFKENAEEDRSTSWLEIINKSPHMILFKVIFFILYVSYQVKTTSPKNYIVRPNQGVIQADSSISVQIKSQQGVLEVNIICYNIFQNEAQILKDKFLVQLAPSNVATPSMTPEALGAVWNGIDKL